MDEDQNTNAYIQRIVVFLLCRYLWSYSTYKSYSLLYICVISQLYSKIYLNDSYGSDRLCRIKSMTEDSGMFNTVGRYYVPQVEQSIMNRYHCKLLNISIFTLSEWFNSHLWMINLIEYKFINPCDKYNEWMK